MLNPAGTMPVLVEEGQPAIPGAAIIAEYIEETLPARPQRGTGCCRRGRRPGRGAPAGELVQRQVLRRGQRPAGERARVQAAYDAGSRRRVAGYRGDARRARQYPLSSGLYRLAGAHARLACRRPAELGRPCRGGASVRRRLPGRCAVERRRSRQELVRAGKVAAVVPRDAGRHAGRAAAGGKLRQSRLLTTRLRSRPRSSRRRARAGFDVAGVTRPDAVPEAKARLERFLADGAPRRHGLDGEHGRAPRPSARAVARRALGRHARHELRAGRRSAGDPRAQATAARFRSTPRATTITT